jgi:type II secretory pathway component GspD/PulD (secretin)
MVTDIPEALDRIAQTVAEYDRPVPQIAIEAKFVETVVTGEDRFGIEWKLGATASSGEFDFGKDFGLPLVYNNMVLGKVDLGQFRANLEIAQSRGLSRVLANPRAVTMDNMTASMNISTEYPEREVSTDPRTGLVLYTWKSRSVPVGIEVTPHVTADGRIAMTLAPEVEAITGYTGPTDDQRPIISRRSAQTQIVVGDGEVAVIGGLIQDNETRNVSKIPLLGDIPILGHLFKKTSITHTKTDLMIFIIPHVLPAEG